MPGKRKAGPAPAEGEGPPAKVQRVEGSDLLQASLKAVYGLVFPEELLVVWEVAGELDPGKPLAAFTPLGLQLVGPFEVLASRSFRDGAKPHLHWRFLFDPPEFMTVAVGPERHYGYFRDDPTALPVLVASGTADGYQFTVEGDTFLAVLHRLCATAKADKEEKKLAAAMARYGVRPADAPKVRAARRRQSVAEPFHGMGMVVPYDPKTEVGYRPLGMPEAKFKALLQRIVSHAATPSDRTEFDTLLTFTDVANDECDFGHGLEVGLDLYCFVGLKDPAKDPLHAHCVRILDLAYMLLGRGLFQSIAQDHLADRSRKDLAQPMDD
eukprot:EG_transcript_18682